MPKKRGEPERGTYCARCGFVTEMMEKKLITVRKYCKDGTHPSISSNHKTKTVLSFSLCDKCYAECETLLSSFVKF